MAGVFGLSPTFEASDEKAENLPIVTVILPLLQAKKRLWETSKAIFQNTCLITETCPRPSPSKPSASWEEGSSVA